MEKHVEKILKQAVRDFGQVSAPYLQRKLGMKFSEATEVCMKFNEGRKRKKVSNNLSGL